MSKEHYFLKKVTNAQRIFLDLTTLGFDGNEEIVAALIGVDASFQMLINAVNRYVAKDKG